MRTIWKNKLEAIDKQTIQLPLGAEILSVQTQNGKPCLWATVDTDEFTEPRTIEIFGTGNPIPPGPGIERVFIGTFQIDGGSFVGHVFERIK